MDKSATEDLVLFCAQFNVELSCEKKETLHDRCIRYFICLLTIISMLSKQISQLISGFLA